VVEIGKALGRIGAGRMSWFFTYILGNEGWMDGCTFGGQRRERHVVCLTFLADGRFPSVVM
jgi:hypothetical protein